MCDDREGGSTRRECLNETFGSAQEKKTKHHASPDLGDILPFSIDPNAPT